MSNEYYKLDQYQIRGKQAIERFLLVMMLVYAFCTVVSTGGRDTLGDEKFY